MPKLFFDTETTGLIDRKADPTAPTQPNLTQIAAILYDDAWREISSLNHIIYPSGWTIPEGASNVHGITTEYAEIFGVRLHSVVSTFGDMVDVADTVVAHNADFDVTVMRRAAFMVSDPDPFDGKVVYCTMKAATKVARILHATPRHDQDFKYPKLEECVKKFFGETLEGAHDALVDIRATVRVYHYLCDHYGIDP